MGSNKYRQHSIKHEIRQKENRYVNIAFLGLGKMGTGIAGRVLETGHPLTIWNRSQAATAPLVEKGAKAEDTSSSAVQNADVVFTMLTDDEATREVTLDANGFLAAMKPGAIHVTLSTISVDLARALTEAHAAKNQEHLGSPVFGRPNVAAEGKLWLAVAGKKDVADQVKPLLETFSRGISIVGEKPWQAHALKLGGNFMITATIQMMAEGFVYAKAQGIDPAVFIETINSALFQSQFVANYAKTILNPPEKPGATVSLGIKDTRLFREAAAEKQIPTPLADYLAERLGIAENQGWQNEDWAVGQYKVAQQESSTHKKG